MTIDATDRKIIAATASGLPIGLQIVGQRFDDLGVLQVARAYEHLRGALRPWPQPPVQTVCRWTSWCKPWCSRCKVSR